MARFRSFLLAALVLATAVLVVQAAPAGAAATRPSTLAVQTRLAALGYLPPDVVSGVADERTRAAILAFQGWEGLARDGIAGPVTFARLAHASRPTPLPGSGTRIEVHLRQQVLLFVRCNRVERAIHVSTGAPGTPTPSGAFRIYRKQVDSWSAPYRVWLPWASYFTGGYAFHGYGDVPAYPASHGCVRIPLAEAPAVYAFARLGVPVRVV